MLIIGMITIILKIQNDVNLKQMVQQHYPPIDHT